MSITFTCPSCDKQYRVKDEFGGRTVVCKNCKKKIAIGANGQTSMKPAETSEQERRHAGGKRKKRVSVKNDEGQRTLKELMILRNRETLKPVARYQKGVLVCLLLQLMAFACASAGPPEYRVLLGYGLVVLWFVGAGFVFLLAMVCSGTGTGVLAGIGALIPYFGIIVLLIVNNSATKMLKKEGIRVGLLGADLSQF
jgi:hypothetical protein